MATRFDWQPVPLDSSTGRIAQRLNALAQRLELVLRGLRRGDSGLVLRGTIESEGDTNGLIVSTPDKTKRYLIAVDNVGAVTTTLL